VRPKFQADENFNLRIVSGLLRREPSIDFQTARAANLLGRGDLEVLAASARERRILVSHDRDTLPAHFDRFRAESSSSRLLIVSSKFHIGAAIKQLLLIWAASEAEEWADRVGFVPF